MADIDFDILPAREAFLVDGHAPQTVTAGPNALDRGEGVSLQAGLGRLTRLVAGQTSWRDSHSSTPLL